MGAVMISNLIIAVLTGLAVLFGFACYDRYFRWRDCFNELGRCYDPQTGMVYVAQAGLVWGALVLLCLAGLTGMVFFKNR